jgi:hypothetical protein
MTTAPTPRLPKPDRPIFVMFWIENGEGGLLIFDIPIIIYFYIFSLIIMPSDVSHYQKLPGLMPGVDAR